MKNKKTIIPWIALAVSAIALLTSIQSCRVSQEANNLQKKLYQESRSTIWLAYYSAEANEFTLKPS
ncbi:MAG: hypothetical protein ACQKBW_13555, partial [Puniceicoccales bacterium]